MVTQTRPATAPPKSAGRSIFLPNFTFTLGRLVCRESIVLSAISSLQELLGRPDIATQDRLKRVRLKALYVEILLRVSASFAGSKGGCRNSVQNPVGQGNWGEEQFAVDWLLRQISILVCPPSFAGSKLSARAVATIRDAGRHSGSHGCPRSLPARAVSARQVRGMPSTRSRQTRWNLPERRCARGPTSGPAHAMCALPPSIREWSLRMFRRRRGSRR